MRLRPLLVLLALLGAAAPGHAEDSVVREDISDDHVIARVRHRGEEVAITAARLRRFARVREPGETPRELLDALITFEVLAIEARHHPALQDGPPVDEAAERALAMRWLREDFEPRHGADNIPLPLLRRAYDQNLSRFVRQEGRKVVHFVVMTQDSKRPEGALEAKAKAIVERLRAQLDAHPPKDTDAFREVAEAVVPEAEAAGLVGRFEDLRPTGRERSPYVPAFVEPIFAAEKAGDVVGPFPTSFGWHVVYLERIWEARNVPFEAAVPELRERLLSDYRQRELRRETEAMAQEEGVSMNLGPLHALEVRRNAEAPPDTEGAPTP